MSRKRRLLTAAPMVLVCVCAAGSAAAADDPGAVQIPTARATEIDVSSGILYDSNIARLHRTVSSPSEGPSAELERLHPEDEMITPDVGVLLARPIGEMMLFLRGDGGYDFHRFNTIRNAAHVDVEGGGGRRFGSCEGGLTGMFGQSQSDLAEVLAVDNNGFPVTSTLKNVETRENVSFSGRCGRSIGLAPTLSVSEAWDSNSEAARRSADNRLLTINAGIGYQQPAFGVVSIFGLYNQASYPTRFASLLAGESLAYGYDVVAGGVRYERHVGVRLDLLASISYTSLSPTVTGAPALVTLAGELEKKFSGLTYLLDATYHVTPRLQAHLSASRATVPSARVDATYSVNETYQADLNYQLNTRTQLKLTVDNNGVSYRGLAAIGTFTFFNLLKGSTTAVTGSATYKLNRRLSLTLSVGDAERRATPVGFGYSSTTAALTARATF